MFAVSRTFRTRFASPGALLDQALAVAHDVAQLALRRWRHEAPAQQAELTELGEPLAVAHVRLDSAVAPPEVGFCYHAATTLPRTRTHEAKVWSVWILGFSRD
jgi:hypothetical protein